MLGKKYLVDLTATEKIEMERLLKIGKHQSCKLIRARILDLKTLKLVINKKIHGSALANFVETNLFDGSVKS